MSLIVQLFGRLFGISLILLSLLWVSENGQLFLINNGFYMDNKLIRSTTGLDDRLPKEMEDKKDLLTDDSPILGLIDVNSLSFMIFLTFGMLLLCVDIKDLLSIGYQISFKYPTKILRDEAKIEQGLKKLSEGYYSSGGAGLSQNIRIKNLPVWPLIVKQVELRMPFKDIQLMMGNNAAFVRKEFDRHIKILNTVSNFIPSLGVVGTVLGLIKLLFNLDDFSNIGPAMALALMTTFYGLLFSVIFFKPMCMRLESLKMAIMNLYQTAAFWLTILEQRKPSFYLEQDYQRKKFNKT